MKASITVRLDDRLKAQAEAVLDELGVSPTQAITHLYLYLAQHGRLPYRIRPVAESPKDVHRAMLHRVRAVTGLLTTVVGLPAEAAESRDMTELCYVRCLQLRQDIASNVDFIAAAFCNDTLTRENGEDPGLYWQRIVENLTRAENAIDQAAPDVNATLAAVTGQLIDYYWRLAKCSDPIEINDLALPFEYDINAVYTGHTLYKGKSR